jgi:hypothetical protein
VTDPNDEALRLWKEDASHLGASLDPERVLARARETAGEATVAARTARRWTAAAAVLLAFGAGGTAWLAVAGPPPSGPDLALDQLERDRVEMQVALELLALPVGTPAGEETPR